MNQMITELKARYGDDFNWEMTDDPALTKEVNLELSNQHPLYGEIENVMARCCSNDDVLFLLKNGNCAIVHLAYSKTNTRGFPKYREFPDINSVFEFIEMQFVSDFL